MGPRPYVKGTCKSGGWRSVVEESITATLGKATTDEANKAVGPTRSLCQEDGKKLRKLVMSDCNEAEGGLNISCIMSEGGQRL